MEQAQLQILIQLKDEVSSAFDKAGKNIAKTAEDTSKKISVLDKDVTGLSKTLLGGATAVGALAIGFGVSAIKAFTDAQVAMARVDSTLNSMSNRTIEVGTGLMAASGKLKVTGVEAEVMNQRIKEANYSIDKSTLAIHDAELAYKAGTIKGDKYSQIVKEQKLSIESTTLAIKAYNQKLKETEDGQTEVTKKIYLSKDAVAAAREKILQTADAMVKLGFDDEDSAESLSRLYQRTGDVTKAMKLNQIAMDLSRSKNIELSQATDLVGQVLSGNGRILKQYGIQINDTTPPLEALKQLQKEVAGQADAFSKTFQGQMQVLDINFQNIKESIGEVLVNALTPFILQFTAWLNNPDTQAKMKVWTAEFQSWADVIIPTIVDTFKLWSDAAQVLYGWMMKIGDATLSVFNTFKNIQNSFDGKDGVFDKIARNLQLQFGIIPGRASGGQVSANQPYIVGEKGPELFMPSGSGSIIPNGKLGGGNVIVNLSGTFYSDSEAAEKMGDQIARIIEQQLKIRTI